MAFVHAMAYAFTNPVFEAPDEPGHLAYVNYVATNMALPNQLEPEHQVAGQGHHYPLFYALGAGLVRAMGVSEVRVLLKPDPKSQLAGGDQPYIPVYDHSAAAFPADQDRNAFFALRLLNCLFVALTAWAAGRAAKLLLPDPFWLAAPLLIATLPQFAFIGGSISNDPLTAFLAAASVFAAVRAWQHPSAGKWMTAGLVVGLAIYAKKSNLILVPALWLLALLPRESEGISRSRSLALGLSVAFLVALPLLSMNMVQYGEPFGQQMEVLTLHALVDQKSFSSPYMYKDLPLSLARSFVAQFGWMNVVASKLLVWPFFLLLLIPVLASFSKNSARLFLGACLLLTVGAVFYYNLTYTQPQGRLLFPALGAVAVLWAAGLARILPNRPKALPVIAVLLLAADAFALLTNLRFYGR